MGDADTAGPILDTAGNVLGSHPGVQFFTIGQRRGLGIAMGEPYYVVDIDPATRAVTVGRREETLVREFFVTDLNWLAIERPGGRFKAEVKIRYNHTPAAATVYPVDEDTVRVLFDSAQKAITPGQAAVFYRGELVLGGGWIDKKSPVGPVIHRQGHQVDVGKQAAHT
jgi:tRNA-specific 2-thiouridylase